MISKFVNRERHCAGLGILRETEVGELARDFLVFNGKHLKRKERGVGGARFADGKRGDGYALRHLNDRMQTVDAAQVLRGNGNAKNGHDALGGEHARQVCCAARACDDGLNAALRGRFGRRAMGPVAPPVDRIRGEYLVGLLLKIESGASSARARELLTAELKTFAGNPAFKSITVVVNVDPQ